MDLSNRTCLAGLLTMLACAGPDRPPPGEAPPDSPAPAAAGLSASPTSSGILLTNLDAASLYFAVYDASVLPFIEWAPCTDPTTCESILPGAQHTVPMPPDSPDTVMVFWWRLMSTSAGTYIPDSVRALAVPVP